MLHKNLYQLSKTFQEDSLKTLEIILDIVTLYGDKQQKDIQIQIPQKEFEYKQLSLQKIAEVITVINKEEKHFLIYPISEYEAFMSKWHKEKLGKKMWQDKLLLDMLDENLDPESFKENKKSSKCSYFIIKDIEKLRQIKEKLDEKQNSKKILLKNKKISFNDNEAIIKVGNKVCQLPPFKNEHFFCRAIFEFPPKEPVDWSIIHEKMTGTEPRQVEKDKRATQDTMYRINTRIKNVIDTDDNLFDWEEKTVVRHY